MMKKVITRMLAFAALMLCGGAWAATWTGDLQSTANDVFAGSKITFADFKAAMPAQGENAFSFCQGSLGGGWMNSEMPFTAAFVKSKSDTEVVIQYQLIDSRWVKLAEVTFSAASDNGISAVRSNRGSIENRLNEYGALITSFDSNNSQAANVYTVKSVIIVLPKQDVTFTTANATDWANKTLPKAAMTTSATGNISFAGNNDYLQSLGSLTNATVALVTDVSNNANIFGLTSTDQGNGSGAITRDVYLKVSGGAVGVITGGEDANWETDTKTIPTGNVLVNVAGNTAVNYVYGAGMGGGKGGSTLARIEGNVGVVIEGNAQVKYDIVGGWQSRHNAQPKVSGNTSVLIKNVQTNAGNIIGGSSFNTNHGGGLVTGNSSVIVNIESSDSATFAKSVIGGSWNHVDNQYNNQVVNGNSSISIAAPNAVTFSGDIVGGGHNGNRVSSSVGGNASVTINGGTYTGTIYAGGDNGTYTPVTGNATLTINGGDLSGATLKGGQATGDKILVINENTVLAAGSVSGFTKIQIADGKTLTLTVAGSNTATITSSIEGPGSIAKNGTGTLVLTGTTTNFGGFTINGGTLQLNAGVEGTMSVKDGTLLILQLSDLQKQNGYTASGVTFEEGNTNPNIKFIDTDGVVMADNTGNAYTARLNTWIGASGGNWSEVSNWSNGVAPVAGEEVLIDLTGDLSINVDADTPVLKSLTIGGSGTLAISGQKLKPGYLKIGEGATLEWTTTQSGDYDVDGIVGPGSLIKKGGSKIRIFNALVGTMKGMDGNVTITIEAGTVESFWRQNQANADPRIGDAKIIVPATGGAYISYGKVYLDGTLTIDNAKEIEVFNNEGQGNPEVLGSGKLVKIGSARLNTRGKFTSNATTIEVRAGELAATTTEDYTIAAKIIGSGKFVMNAATRTFTVNNAGNEMEGGVVVEAGTLKMGAQHGIGSKGRNVKVKTGATFDVGGQSNHGLTLELAGGTLTNSGGAGGDTAILFRSMTMTAASTININGMYGIVYDNYYATTFDMGGFTLTKTGTGNLRLNNVTIKNPGLIDMQGGSIERKTSEKLKFDMTDVTAAEKKTLVQYPAETAASIEWFELTNNADGYTLATEDNLVVLNPPEAGAQIGETVYPTLRAALTAAETMVKPVTITLLKDVIGGMTIPSGGVRVDITGKSVTGRVVVGEGSYLIENGKPKIDGIASDLDLTFNGKMSVDHSNVGGSVNCNGTASYNNDKNDTSTGIYLKHRPWVDGAGTFFTTTEKITFATAGVMPNQDSSIFVHMGDAYSSSDYGLFLATGTNDTEVVVGYNQGTSTNLITTIKVPNARSHRHSYVITKDDDMESNPTKTTFTIYLDGVKWKTFERSPRFEITGGFQVGSCYHHIVDGHNMAPDNNNAYVNFMRAYQRIITTDEIKRYSEVYDYTSPNGTYKRSVTTDGNWVAENEWNGNVEKPTSKGNVELSIDTEGEATATIDVNLTEEVEYEKLTITSANGKSVKFTRSEMSAKSIKSVCTVIGTTVTLGEDTLDLKAGPTIIVEGGKLNFDFSGLSASAIAAEHNGVMTEVVTGDIDSQNEGIITVIRPTDADVKSAEVVYKRDHYEVVIRNFAAKIIGDTVQRFDDIATALSTATTPTDVVILNGDTTLPEGYEDYRVGDNGQIIVRPMIDGEEVSLSNATAGTDSKSNFTFNQTYTLIIPTTVAREAGTKVLVRYVDVATDETATTAANVPHMMQIAGVNSKAVSLISNGFGSGKHKLRYEFEGLILTCGGDGFEITMLNSSMEKKTDDSRFLLRDCQNLTGGATANAIIHDSKYSKTEANRYCITCKVTANAVVDKLAANYVGDAYASYGTAADVVTAAKAGIVGLASNVTLSPAAGDVLTLVKNGKTVTISGTPQALETTYVGVTTYDVFKRIIYQTSSTGYLCSTSFACSHSDHGVIEGTTPFNLSSDGTGSAVGWEEGDVIVITHISKYYIGPGLSGKTFIVPSGKEFSLYQTGATGASFVNAKVYVVGTVNQSGSTIKNSSFILRGGKLNVTESYTGTLAITGYGTATKNDAALALPFYGVKPESDGEEVVIEEVVETVEIVPNTNVKVPVDTEVSKITVKYGETVLTEGPNAPVSVSIADDGSVELTTTDSAKPAATDIAMSTPTDTTGETPVDEVAFTITNPIPGLFYEIVSGDSFDEHGALVVDHDAEKGTSQATTSAEAKTVSIPMTFAEGKKVKYYKVSVKATK